MNKKKSHIVASFFILLLLSSTPSLAYDNETKTMGYIEKPESAIAYETGLSYRIIHAGAKENDKNNIFVRSLINAWGQDGREIANAEKDGLDATNPKDISVSHPFLATILKATPNGAHYQWWVRGENIPETASGYTAQDTFIDIQVQDRVAPIGAPENVSQIPANATITEGGGGFMLLSQQTNGQNPSLTDNIKIHYTGWQTDGKMFDSSKLRGEPNIFPLGRLIAGWQKAVPLMHVGETARIWIPGDLAYDNRADRPFAPKGMLVFDIELIAIEPAQ